MALANHPSRVGVQPHILAATADAQVGNPMHLHVHARTLAHRAALHPHFDAQPARDAVPADSLHAPALYVHGLAQDGRNPEDERGRRRRWG